MSGRILLRLVAVVYLAGLLVLPLGMILWRTFEHGPWPVWEALTSPYALHALWLTLLMVVISVPLNTLFGVGVALLLARGRFPGKSLLSAIIDLPLALSPVVVGLALVLAYGTSGWFGPALQALGIRVIFALPGMVLANVFISLPFVAKEVLPVLREIGQEQEQAAYTLGASPLQTFIRVTLPAIRSAVAYGVVLTTARVLGEYGAVNVVSGNLEGRTQTLTMYVADRFQQYDETGTYAASVLLACLGVAMLLVINRFTHKGEAR